MEMGERGDTVVAQQLAVLSNAPEADRVRLRSAEEHDCCWSPVDRCTNPSSNRGRSS